MVSATADQDAGAYLRAIGERVREGRARRGMSRKSLAKDSGVSERYLALLEAGEGNGSVLLLRDVARALGVPLDTLLADGPSAAPDLSRAIEADGPDRFAKVQHGWQELAAVALADPPTGTARSSARRLGQSTCGRGAGGSRSSACAGRESRRWASASRRACACRSWNSTARSSATAA